MDNAETRTEQVGERQNGETLDPMASEYTVHGG